MTQAPFVQVAHRFGMWACAVLLAVSATACAPAVTRESQATTYQVAVGAYYALLADEIDVDTARVLIDQALAVDASDDAIRMVAAQLELYEFRRSGSLRARARLIGQLVAIDASLRSGATAVDWVEARLYVTLGDLLTVDAQRDEERSLEGTDATYHRWLALTRLDAANTAYRYARSLGGDDASQGLLRERLHAATAQVSGTMAVVSNISALTASPETPLGQKREDAVADLETSLRADVGDEVLADPPLRAAVGLDGSAHVVRAVAFETLAADANELMQAVCIDADMEARSEALDQVVERLWWAAHHTAVAKTLGVERDAFAVVGFLHDFANRDPERPCEPSGDPLTPREQRP